jgi:transketolase
VQVVESGENVTGILEALQNAKAETGRPSFILLRTIIGFPAPNKMNTGKAHGAALGDDEVAEVKKILGFDPEQKFVVQDEVLAHTREVVKRGEQAKAEWQPKFEAWAKANPERKELLDRLTARELPEGWAEKLPTWQPDAKGLATRKASSEVLAAVADVLPELWGGSADLAESNNTTMKGADSFGPADISTKEWNATPYGRTLHFGVREHAMGSILNGIALHGPTRPYGGTFLVFSDYMRPAVRLGSLMKTSAIYVWTHDSIGLGEDGPTHQPIEHLAALRAIPGLTIVRPGDANETAAAWKATIERPDGPVGLALTRQNLPVLEGTDAEGVAKGGYVLADAANGDPQVVLIATGSELQIAVEARKVLSRPKPLSTRHGARCSEWRRASE